jgi:ParB-like chromosome segregation protein Spo0J
MPQLLTIPRAQLLPPPRPMRATITDDMIDEKVESMKVVGQLVPLIVTPTQLSDAAQAQADAYTRVLLHLNNAGAFEIIDGHCRWLAAEHVPLTHLDCCVFLDVQEAKHAMMLHAGIIRQSFTAYEEGRQFIELSNEHGWSLEQLCKTFHRSESYINDRVAIAESPEQVAMAVHTRAINLAQAKQVLRAKDEMLRCYLLDQAMVHGATARTLEVMIHNWKVENEPRADGELQHTPAHANPPNPNEPKVCIWCREGDDPQNFREVIVHWYHERDLRAIVDQVGSHNLHHAAAPPEPVPGES